jgi:elongation factor G
MGRWQVLEPIMTVEVTCPSEFQGEIIAQISRRNGVLVSTNEIDNWFTINAEVFHCFNVISITRLINNNNISIKVPLNDMFGYSTDLRSSTQGKGEFTMEYCRYSPARASLQQELVDKYNQELQTNQLSKRN